MSILKGPGALLKQTPFSILAASSLWPSRDAFSMQGPHAPGPSILLTCLYGSPYHPAAKTPHTYKYHTYYKLYQVQSVYHILGQNPIKLNFHAEQHSSRRYISAVDTKLIINSWHAILLTVSQVGGRRSRGRRRVCIKKCPQTKAPRRGVQQWPRFRVYNCLFVFVGCVWCGRARQTQACDWPVP